MYMYIYTCVCVCEYKYFRKRHKEYFYSLSRPVVIRLLSPFPPRNILNVPNLTPFLLCPRTIQCSPSRSHTSKIYLKSTQ